MATETTKKATPAVSTLPKEIFAVEVNNHELLKRAYDTYLSNSRTSGAKTLKRGEVSGGGKKPWKQKGTGRARFGSSRNPIWRGGGIAFGPTGNENYTRKLSTTSKRVAVRQALTLANNAKQITVLDDFATPGGKTKETVAILAKHKIVSEARVLLVVDEKTDMVLRSTNNVPQIKLVRPTYLNVYDILNADVILITKQSLPIITDWLSKKGDA